MDHMFLEVRDIKKSYGKEGYQVQVLKGVNMTVSHGEICTILGASGSGKSTLLNIIGGLDSADSGSITVESAKITEYSPVQMTEYRRSYLGFIFQFYNLVPNLTVRENIETCKYLSKDHMDTDQLLESLGLSKHGRKFPAQLSGGEQQRCAIGRALVKRPRLLLCDEPTGALDSKTSRDILQLLEDVNKAYGTTILMVTHNREISKMADKIVEMKDGLIIKAVSNTRMSASEMEL